MTSVDARLAAMTKMSLKLLHCSTQHVADQSQRVTLMIALKDVHILVFPAILESYNIAGMSIGQVHSILAQVPCVWCIIRSTF